MQRSRGRTIAAVTAAALVLVTAGCGGDEGGGAATPGVSDTEVLVGTHMPLTGPAAAGYSKIAPATRAFFEHVNANGGVHGRSITYKIMDDTYNPATTQQVVRELVLQDKIFALLNGLGTPTHSGVLDFLKTNRVPDMFVASGSRSWNQPAKYPGTFGFNPDYTVEGKILATHVKTDLAGRTVCFLGQDDDFGRDSLAGIEQVLGAGALAAKQTYVTSNPNLGPQIGAFKQAGCQVVMLATVPGFTALAVGTAAKIGFKPQFVVSNVGSDHQTLATRLGPETRLLEGMVSANYLPLVTDTANPWIQLFTKINNERNGGGPLDNNIVYGMSVGYLFVQALQAAGKDLTRDGLIAAVEKGGFAGPGLAPLRYAKDNHAGYGGQRLVRVSGGKQAYFGPAYESDSGTGPVAPYNAAPAAPPANGVPVG